MHELFKVDINKLNLLQLADWIKRCRGAVGPDADGRTDGVIEFCEDWRGHAETYATVYDSDLYRKAILANAIETDEYFTDMDGWIKDVTEVMYNLTVTYDEAYRNIQACTNDYTDKRYKDIDKYLEAVEKALNADNYRHALRLLVLHRKRHKINIIKVIKDKKKYTKMSVARLLQRVSEYELVSLDKEFSESKKELTSKNNRKVRDFDYDVYFLKDVQADLDRYNIKKQQYFNYFVNELVKEYDKKLFGNLCFYLSLDLERAEKLYNLNGYTICLSKEQSDIILTECFRLGFPLLYANILLARAENVTATLDARAFPNRKPNIDVFDFEDEAEESTKYREQLNYAINRVTRFLESKRKSISGRKDKIKKYKAEIKAMEKEKDTLTAEIDSLEQEIAKIGSSFINFRQQRTLEVQKEKKEKRIGALDRQTKYRQDSITLHEKAIADLETEEFQSDEFVSTYMPAYDGYKLEHVEVLLTELLTVKAELDSELPKYDV